MIIPPKAAMTRGTAVHSGIEFNYTQKMETKKDLPLEEVKEYTAAVFEEKAEETDFEGEDKGKVKDSTISLAGLYHEEVAPTVQPEAVEKKVEVAFEGTDYTLLGYIDLIDHKKRIRDTKTTGKTPSESVIRDNLQLAAYSLMYQTITGEEESGVGLDYLVDTKNPKVVQFEAKVTEAERQRFLKIMDAVAKAIEGEHFYPNYNNFMCSQKNCGYWDICHKEW
jgi:CRISPR/Cas system-associated exonuclease Cas4 (RecB family)